MMASERLQVILELVTGQYKREAGEAAAATGRIASAAGTAGGGLQGLTRGFGALKGALAAVGIAQIAGQMRDMAMAAVEDAESQERLAGGLRTNLGATDDMIAGNERWISSMQIATRTADTDLRQAVNDLTVAGRGLEDAQNDIAIAADIAASKGLELGAVIKALVRAQASGSTGGLARLGIDTKNAAGEMLTYDEVLQNAAKTMGGAAATAAGTLAGALERSKIAMEEAREEAGANFAPTLVTLTDGLNELKTAALGGNTSLAGLQTIFNSLITSGINPMEDALASAGFVLSEFALQFREPIDTQTFETLIMMLGLTNEQVLELRRNFIQNGDALGINEEKLGGIIGQLDAYVGVADPAVLATRRYQKAQQDAATAALAAAEGTREAAAALLELANPAFAASSAVDRMREAQEKMLDVLADPEATVHDGAEAQLEYARAVLEAQAALDTFDESGIEGALDAIATALGISTDKAQELLEELGLLDGKTVKTVIQVDYIATGANPTTGLGGSIFGGPRATGGPVSAMRPYTVGERGAELFVPSTNGFIVPNSQLNAMGGWGSRTVNIAVESPMNEFRSDLQYASVVASLVNYVEGM